MPDTISDPDLIVLALGNPLLGDDGVGWRVAGYLQLNIPNPAFDLDSLAEGGLSIMERISGYRRAIIIDAIHTGQYPDGHISSFPLDALPNPFAGHLGSTHETSLLTALKAGRTLGIDLPEQITIVAIEARNLYEFSEQLSPAVAAAIEPAARLVIELAAGSA
jgi:hydrogenase maturation protease